MTLCTVTADTMAVPKRRQPPRSAHGSHWYGLSFDIVLLFGLTELKAQIAWTENVCHRFGFILLVLTYLDFRESRSVVLRLSCTIVSSNLDNSYVQFC